MHRSYVPDSRYFKVSRYSDTFPVFMCFFEPAYEVKELDAFARITQSGGSVTGI